MVAKYSEELTLNNIEYRHFIWEGCDALDNECLKQSQIISEEALTPICQSWKCGAGECTLMSKAGYFNHMKGHLNNQKQTVPTSSIILPAISA